MSSVDMATDQGPPSASAACPARLGGAEHGEGLILARRNRLANAVEHLVVETVI